MAFDYKKEYKEFYMPPRRPVLVEVPPMNYVAVWGNGDPNSGDGQYQRALSMLYAAAFTIKMSYKGDHRIDGYFDYVVPPLEGLWWMENVAGVDYQHKEEFCWISMIRLPEFVTPQVLEWAKAEAAAKKGLDMSPVRFFTYDEGLCVQCMHIGPYDDEPVTVELMTVYAAGQGYQADMDHGRYHHEIYLSDSRRCAPARLKTVIRHPLRPWE